MGYPVIRPLASPVAQMLVKTTTPALRAARGSSGIRRDRVDQRLAAPAVAKQPCSVMYSVVFFSMSAVVTSQPVTFCPG